MRLFFLLFAIPLIAFGAQNIVAVVNNKVITDLDLKNRINLLVIANNIPTAAIPKIKSQVLQMLIDDKLFEIEAERLKIKVDDKEVEEAVVTICAQNKIKPTACSLFLKGIGISKDELKKQLYHQMLWSRIIKNMIEPKSNVSETEVSLICKKSESAYEIAEIVIYPANGDEKIAVTTMQELRNKAIKGAKFDKLAKNFSQSSTAGKSGYVGWVDETQLPNGVLPAIQKLPTGSVSEIIITNEGIFLIKVINKKASASGEQQRVEVANGLKQKKLASLVKSYLNKLRSNFYIEVK